MSSAENGAKIYCTFCSGCAWYMSCNSGLPLPCNPHPHHLVLLLSSLPHGPEEGERCSLPQFPSSSSLRPSSLFPGQVTRVQLNEESCAYNAGSPRQSSSGLSGGDLGQLLSTRLIVSPQQIFPQCCYKTSIRQTPAGLQALLSAGKEAGGTTDDYSKSELTIKISLEIAAK